MPQQFDLWDNPIGNKKTVESNPQDDISLDNPKPFNPNKINQNSPHDVTEDMLPVSVDDKRVINGKTDINQLAPFKYPWAWDMFLKANNNHWVPTEISMVKDIVDWKQKLTTEEKHVYSNVLAYLTTSDILAMRNIGLAVMEKMTAPELQMYQAVQVKEECLTFDHDVLTKTGWKSIGEVTKDDMVFTYDKEKSINRFTKINHLYHELYTGPLYNYESRNMSQCVTKEHRMPVLDKNGNYLIKKAKYFKEGLSYLGFITPAIAHVEFNGFNEITPHERFLIALQADGTIRKESGDTNDPYKYRNGNKCGYVICSFSFTKERKNKRFISLLNETEYEYTTGKGGTNKEKTIYNVKVPRDKLISKDFKDWVSYCNTPQWCREFIEEITYWDGYRTEDYLKEKTSDKPRLMGYDSTNKENADIVATIAVMAGYGVSQTVYTDDRKETYKDLHRIYITPSLISRNVVNVSINNVSDIQIACISVDTGVFYVRRNNKVTLTGNSIHTWTYQSCIENLGLDQGEIYNRYRTIPEIHGKIKLSGKMLEASLNSNMDLEDPDQLEDFMMSYMFFAAVFEGAWFYNGFTPIYSLQRRGLMTATGEQLQYIQRDESLHSAFGIKVVNQIVKETGFKWNQDKVNKLWEECLEAETNYINYVLRDPILGYSAEQHIGQYRFLINRRARQLHLPEPYPGQECSVAWLDEQINIRKEKNFFETRVTEYQVGASLKWD